MLRKTKIEIHQPLGLPAENITVYVLDATGKETKLQVEAVRIHPDSVNIADKTDNTEVKT